MSTFNYSYDEENNKLHYQYILRHNWTPKKIDQGKIQHEVSDATNYNKIKLEYIVKKNKTEIKIFDKEDIIIKDPNPFSFFTSTCVNGYAKGWKRLYPPKSKGKLLSIDSGFDSDGDGVHSM